MKIYGLLIGAALLVSSCATESKKVEEEKIVTEEKTVELGESYGEFNVNPEEAISVEEMLKAFNENPTVNEFTFEAPLIEVCSKAGCWVNIEKGNGETFMVRFKDHFTIPPATEVGTEAYLHGVAHYDTISVELLQHFAEDAGKTEEEINEITEPKFEVGFECDGITLKK